MRYEIELTDEQARAVDRAYPMGTKPYFADDEVDRAMYAVALAVRSNPPKPARMDEPGWGEKVLAGYPQHFRTAERTTWLHVYGHFRLEHWEDPGGTLVKWADLIDPEPYKADA